MKLILCAIAILVSVCFVSVADQTAVTTTALNLKLTLYANGPIDSPPTWESSGVGSLQIASDKLSALYVTDYPGTNLVTVTVLSFGKSLTQKLAITVNPIPATVLSINAIAVSK